VALQRAFELMPRANAGPRNIATSLGNLALVHAAMGDAATGLRLIEQALNELDQAGVGAEDTFRVSLESSHIRVMLAGDRVAQATARLNELLALVRRTQGEGSSQYGELLNEEVEAARQARDVVRGGQLLAEARVHAVKRGMPETHAQFARFLRYEAAFASLRGDLPGAERALREALQRLQPTANTFEVALTRSELAQTLVARGKRSEASEMLAQALPVLQRAVLPRQVDLRAAEALASQLEHASSQR
jgi:serine/threonine-protein kinase